MTQSLQELCELQIENEKVIRGASFLEDSDVIKVGALFYTTGKTVADAEKIRACKEILKRKTGLFSNFRGFLQFAIQVKMSVAPDPEEYLDAVLEIYHKIVEGRILPGEILAMAAMTIYDQLNGRDADSVIATVREVYARIKQRHKFLTDENDLSYIALMVLSGKDVDRTVEEVESLYVALKERFRMPSDTAQSAALVLSMSKKPVDQKVESFISLYEALKDAKHATSKQKAMSVYAAFADLDISRDLLVGEISEVDEWLKHQKGYGFLSSSDVRRVMAATLVLQQHGAQSAVPVHTEASTVATQVIAEEVILTMIMLIVISASVSASVNYS
jgi:hypothetical protein